MEKKFQSTIAQNIKKYRLLNNMTQKELSEKIYLDTQYYAQLERGERNFSLEKISMICSLFHIGIEEIIELDSDTSLEQDYSCLLDDINITLENFNYSQLQIVKRFIDNIVPYI